MLFSCVYFALIQSTRIKNKSCAYKQAFTVVYKGACSTYSKPKRWGTNGDEIKFDLLI